MRESSIESYLVRKVKEHGGLCYKFVSPGNPGVPDRSRAPRGARGLKYVVPDVPRPYDR